MKRRFPRHPRVAFGLSLLTAGAAVVLMSPAWAADSASSRFEPRFHPELQVAPAPGEIKVDGDLADLGWQGAAPAGNFTEHSPGEEVEPPVRTEVFVTFDAAHLYLAAVCYSDPDHVRASICERERIFDDDNIGFFFDPFGDASRAYIININPYGIQYDALWSPNFGEDSNFDLVFESAGKITDSGYQVELAIPFKALRFPNREEQEWRFDFYRHHQREVHYAMSWAAYDQNEACWPCQWGTIRGIRGVRPGRGLDLLASYVAQQSAFVSDADYPRESFVDGHIQGDPSLGGRYALTSEAVVEATINPDYSQIEADASQVDVNTTFALSYPERRPFFQEGTDLFMTNFYAVYTRSVNSPRFAAKGTVKAGRTSVAALSAYDRLTLAIIPLEERSESVPIGGNWVNVAAARSTFGRDNHIRGVVTDRRYDGGGSGSLLSLDGAFRLTKSVKAYAQMMWTNTQEPVLHGTDDDLDTVRFADGRYTAAFDGESYSGTAALVKVNYDSRKLWLSADAYQRTPAYRAENGYQPRNNDRRIEADAQYHWRMNGSVITRIDPTLAIGRIWNFDGVRKDEWISARLNSNLAFAQGFWSLGYMRSRERFRGMDYDGIWALLGEASARIIRALSAGVEFAYGAQIARDYDALGMETQAAGWVDVRPTRRLLAEYSLVFTQSRRIGSPGLHFNGYISRLRLTYQATRALSLRLVTEYNEFASRWSLDPLVTFRLNPFSTFYLGATYDYSRFEECGQLQNMTITCLSKRQFFVKLQYLFQT